MFTILLILHVIACFLLVTVVLMQTGKGGLGSALGGGDSFFGGKGAAPFLSTATTVLAVVFMVTSLSLALVSGRRTKAATAIERSLQQDQRRQQPPEVPQAPQGQPAQTPAFPTGK